MGLDIHNYDYRYNLGSIKKSSTSDRDQELSWVYTLCSAAKTITAENDIDSEHLTVSTNKKQLISLIVNDHVEYRDKMTAKIVLTGNDPTPVEISGKT